ncbi:MAG: TraB/GumN family protein [Hellea sp.]|nr:TraB/GumN family protein [Hellea sp.]
MELKWDAAVKAAESSNGSGNPALWKMGDSDTTIYLFGTVHVLPVGLEWQNEVIEDAFSESDTVYFEIDVESDETSDTFSRLVKETGYLPVGENLFDKMNRKEAKKVKKALAEINYDPEAIADMMPWNASMNISDYHIMVEGYNPLKGVEMVLWAEGMDQGKNFGHMETVEEQFVAISGGDFDEQLEELINWAESADEIDEALSFIIEEWRDGDVNGLSVLTSKDLDTSEGSYDRILVSRNRTWVPRIEAILDDPGSHFIAVGAAHLAGPDSVILMLEDKGYQLDQIQ